jgi:type II secretory pathway component PulK
MSRRGRIDRGIAWIAVIAAVATLSAVAAASIEVRTLQLGSTFTVTGLTGSLASGSIE